MTGDQTTPKTIDEYIAACPPDVRESLQQIRATIRKAAPGAQEAIKYQIPTFTLHGNLISFAAYKGHIGLYPAPTGSARFNEELTVYRTEKSTVRFPLDKPIPFDLVAQMVDLRVKDNLGRAEARKASASIPRPAPSPGSRKSWRATSRPRARCSSRSTSRCPTT